MHLIFRRLIRRPSCAPIGIVIACPLQELWPAAGALLRRCTSYTCAIALIAGAAPPTLAQDSSVVSALPEARAGSELLIPLGSVLLPGLGQFIVGAHREGVAYTATAATGAAVFLVAGSDDAIESDALPRDADGQLAYAGLQVLQTAGFLSAWDAFHRTVPALQREGKYRFLTISEGIGPLLTAPFDPDFLDHPTTWLNLAYTGLVAGLLVAGRDRGVEYEPFRLHDAAFVASSSFNAGAGEEALFRGWLLPVLHQNFGRRFWVANAVQAGVFGVLHAAQAREFAAVIAAWALYEGWVTKRNDWSIRESIFHHFWYDAVIITTSLLIDEQVDRIRVMFPTIRF